MNKEFVIGLMGKMPFPQIIKKRFPGTADAEDEFIRANPEIFRDFPLILAIDMPEGMYEEFENVKVTLYIAMDDGICKMVAKHQPYEWIISDLKKNPFSNALLDLHGAVVSNDIAVEKVSALLHLLYGAIPRFPGNEEAGLFDTKAITDAWVKALKSLGLGKVEKAPGLHSGSFIITESHLFRDSIIVFSLEPPLGVDESEEGYVSLYGCFQRNGSFLFLAESEPPQRLPVTREMAELEGKVEKTWFEGYWKLKEIASQLLEASALYR